MSNNFAKVYESLLDSTLFFNGGKNACWLFVVMLLKSDKDGYIRIADQGIAQRAGMTSQEFKKSITYLMSPDPDSNLDKCDGRRVLPLKDMDDEAENRGYLVVNKGHYRDKGSSTERSKKCRRRDEIMKLISDLQGEENNGTLRERCATLLYVYVSVYVSDISIRYLYECKVDFNLWAKYETYRKNDMKKPLKSDAGRTRQINIIKNCSFEVQEKIITETIDNEWVSLYPLKEGNDPGGGSNGKSSTRRTQLENTADAFKNHINRRHETL